MATTATRTDLAIAGGHHLQDVEYQARRVSAVYDSVRGYVRALGGRRCANRDLRAYLDTLRTQRTVLRRMAIRNARAWAKRPPAAGLGSEGGS